MSKKIEDLIISRLEHLRGDFILMDLQSDSDLPEIHPGQFVEVEIEGSPTTFLRRPYSIHDVDYENRSFSLLIKIVGDGTLTLSKMEEGALVNVIYPLGNMFTLNEEKKIIFIGGGYGIAPFFYFSKILNQKNIKPVILLGAKTKTDLVRLDEYEKLGELFITTEDGSLGHKGLVLDHPILEQRKSEFEKIYTCGPEPMMKAVGKFALSNNINCEISLDNLMACGIGACLCCVTKTTEGNKMVCAEGPIFNIKDLAW